MDIKLLTQYENEGWLYSQRHPSLSLIIWNYSQSTQFEGFWNDITLATRGLVTDESGNVVARPFKKFFNIEEGRFTPTPDYKVFGKGVAMFSCCTGEVVDEDTGLCPVCYEHLGEEACEDCGGTGISTGNESCGSAEDLF